MFHKGRLNITVSKCFVVDTQGQLQPITSSNFVEITCVVISGFVIFILFQYSLIILLELIIHTIISKELMMNEIKRFADLLTPYLQMRKTTQILEELKAEDSSQI